MSAITTKETGASASQTEPKASAPAEVTPDLIRRRAYEIFCARNDGPGDHVSDWVQAEHELIGASRSAPAAVRHGPEDRSPIRRA